MKTVDFSDTIAVCDLKVGRCRQLIDIMKVCEYSRSRSFLYRIFSRFRMFCALLGHTGERLQDHWSSGFILLLDFVCYSEKNCEILKKIIRFVSALFTVIR